MQKDLRQRAELFQLVASLPNTKVKEHILKRGRFLIGSTESCDIVIYSPSVSPVHAVIEISNHGMKLFDMNSKMGTYINEQKTIVSDINEGDKINFGEVEFTLAKYISTQSHPVLPSLEPQAGEASIIKPPSRPELPSEIPVVEKKSQEDTPYIVYPLSKDPNADYSEYIFEDADELYPIFQYQIDKQAVEIIILFNDKVYSVDYLPQKDGIYQITGLKNDKKQVEFPYLGKNEKVPFVEIQSGNCLVHRLHQYEAFHLSDKGLLESKETVVNLQDDDIVRLQKEHLEIFVRKVASPPKVKTAPFFRRDPHLKKYVALVLLFILLPLIGLNFYQVDEELKKEDEPERIATILYKQKLNVSTNKSVAKSEKKKKTAQKAPKKKVVKKEEPKKKPAPKQKNTVQKKVTQDPGKKTAPKKQVVKRVKNPAPKRNQVAKTKSAAVTKTRTASARKAAIQTKSVGRVDVYKSADFKSSISSLMAKGGSLRGTNTSASVDTSSNSSASIGGGVETNIRKANVGTEVGSLTGSTVGKLGQSKGTEGLSAKTGVYTAGIPSETVVLGSMDPDVIRRILREHLPQFRYCYQKELDKTANKNLSGIIKLIFTIGATGHVSKAGVGSGSQFPGHVKRCVVNVLRGIKFPRPLGGGTVDVRQPFNFFPKKL